MDTRRVSGEVKARLPGERRFQRRGGREGASSLLKREIRGLWKRLSRIIYFGVSFPRPGEYSVNRDKDADAAHVSGVNFAKRKKCQRLIQRERGGPLVGNMGRTIVNSDPCPRVCHALA